ncbi:hypothetical protein IC620_01155 [Hazenella sp. IB182357]|uniref:Uncharacterized protein n=1 Tax=Polycladospora coralii TaxID=2771432 RepID=A0A926N9I0_9BACL|nr:hypothetical protein [Polycladospora coralii]MBD1370970.1 hypothetical protein [Polycladospora coralii]MBS7529909.1 hypothetical protein [Polycladospora coralii]
MSFFNELKQKIEKGVETAGKQSQRMIEISRLNIKIKGKRDNQMEEMLSLGRELYENWEPDKEPIITKKVKDKLKHIREIEGAINQLTQNLEKLKAAEIRVKAETVEIENEVGARVSSVNSESEKKEHVLPESMVYICPFCVNQINMSDAKCSHCNQQFY